MMAGLRFGLLAPAAALAAPAADAASLKNVLMLAVDDLRPIGTVFGEPEALVPTLDKLASESVVFGNAWVQCATCGVSRSSLLTGRRPDTTQVLNNGICPFTSDPRHKDWVSLPQYFKNHGYTTAGMGKSASATAAIAAAAAAISSRRCCGGDRSSHRRRDPRAAVLACWPAAI